MNAQHILKDLQVLLGDIPANRSTEKIKRPESISRIIPFSGTITLDPIAYFKIFKPIRLHD
jgi:hypothetical protein